MTAASSVRALDVHADYVCGRTGVCCSAGWDIPVESHFYRGLRAALADRRLPVAAGFAGDPLPASGDLPDGFAGLLARTTAGRCVFLGRGADGRVSCEVHARLGEDALPMTCRHFPRVCLLTPDGVDLSLSHFCPTAAGLLFRPAALRVVDDPPAFPRAPWYEGLDGRRSPGPLLRPGVFLGWDAHHAFERFAVDAFARAADVRVALDAITSAAERARAWTAADGPLDALLSEVLAHAGAGGTPSPRDDATLWADLVSSVPPTVRLDDGARSALAASPAGRTAADRLALREPVRNYLAARTFASWLAVQAQGLRAAALGPRLAWTALRVQLGRLAPGAHEVDDATLKEAIRAADLVLVHLCAPEVLASRVSAVEP